jgi:hypothetical protein
MCQVEDPQKVAEHLVESHADNDWWLDRFARAFDAARGGDSLSRILRVWGLSQAEFGSMLGVSRQAIGKWMKGSIPGDRLVLVGDLAAATDLLVHHLKADRIAGVVRRKADALAGQSLVDMVSPDGAGDVLAAVRAMFDVQRIHA